jgi:hypothetical protein
MNHIVAISRQDNLTTLAATVRTAHAGAMLGATNLIEHMLVAGDALIAAKAVAGHGTWLLWLREKCDLSERQAQKYMTIARGRAVLEANPTRGADLTLTAALKLLPSKKTPPVTGQIPHARGISNRNAPKPTRHDVFVWFGTAPVVEHQRLFDGLGARVVAAAIPQYWNMRLAAAGESVGQITAQQRDATIRSRHRQLGPHPDAVSGIPDDIVAVSDDGLDIPACLRRAAPARPLPPLDWKAATAEQRAAYVARIPIREWLAALSREQRLELEDRIDGLRAAQAKSVTAIVHH